MASPDPPEDESETSHYRSLVTWDTEYSADSVEWCPISPFQEILAIGTYQVDKSSQEKFSPGKNKTNVGANFTYNITSPFIGQRKGRIYLHKFNPDSNTSVLTQTLETAAILDMKWCPHAIGSDKVVLATVDAAATLTIYQLIRSTEHLEKLSDLKLRPEDDALALSLDFSSRKSPDPTPLISVSDSKGGVTLVRMSGDLTVISTVPDCHRFEAWITAFDAWNSKLFFTGGDDSKLKGFCLDDGTETARPVFTIGKEHMAGVTSLLSDVYREHRLYSGRYCQHSLFSKLINRHGTAMRNILFVQ